MINPTVQSTYSFQNVSRNSEMLIIFIQYKRSAFCVHISTPTVLFYNLSIISNVVVTFRLPARSLKYIVRPYLNPRIEQFAMNVGCWSIVQNLWQADETELTKATIWQLTELYETGRLFNPSARSHPKRRHHFAHMSNVSNSCGASYFIYMI